MKLRRTLVVGISVMALAVPASSDQPVASTVPRGNYDMSKLRGICSFAYSRMRAPEGSGYRFMFEKMMDEAVGVNSGDDVETRRNRVRYLWLDNQDYFVCDASNFNLINGNLLKYSVSSRSYDILNVALENWQLELNFIDHVDHRTLLDYVAREAAANSGNSDSPTLDEFKWVLEEIGAKHCFELIEPKHCEHPDKDSFLKQKFPWPKAEREASLRVIAEFNEQLRLSPLKPYKPL